MESIRQNTRHLLPDWRNQGVLWRAIIGVNLLALGAALVEAHTPAGWLAAFMENAAWVEPLLLANLLFLALARDALWRCPPRLGQGVVLLAVAGSAIFLQDSWRFLGLTQDGLIWRAVLLAVGCAALALGYFELRAQALLPYLAEARLAALNARIRPHFLFNALNAAIALIRSDPRGAENALESLSDLFRALLKNTQELTPLSAEIALGRQYLELEKLRLGERLQARWDIEVLPQDTLVPPLMLQPLLENAVYHGIEPSAQAGEIQVRMDMKDDRLRLEVINTMKDPDDPGEGQEDRPGNRMALENIRQRLALYYDMEATLEHGVKNGLYRVRVECPCRTRNFSV
ncbi:MAG: histidine kinase [Zoogloeaceae bacterium]|jgi:two-component system sensor histidine kinase AlgZ|nr:histidine kinase [Zoogloeaceae bacterium]